MKSVFFTLAFLTLFFLIVASFLNMWYLCLYLVFMVWATFYAFNMGKVRHTTDNLFQALFGYGGGE